ncbi:MAG: glutamate ABC transporter substrate-binding protein [Beutenbergiaceae bacterium]
MNRTRGHRGWTGLSSVLAVLVLVGACAWGSGADDLGRSDEQTPSETGDSGGETGGPTSATCANPVQSYAPVEPLPGAGQMPSGSTMERIYNNGALVVGVSADTLRMGARDPFTGQIEGFDIDILREIARAIFGDPDRLQFRVITSAQRIDVLTSGEVDVVARAFTITCQRWQEIAFSAEYFHSGQKVLVSQGSTAAGLADLAGQRVCAPAGTTTLERLSEFPEVEAVAAPTHSQCLALFQQGQVDAITGDDTILAGFAAQDPYAVVVGEAISDEPYGLGIPPENVDMVIFVNGVLEQIMADGTWTQIYDRWLADLGPAPIPPAPVYGR